MTMPVLNIDVSCEHGYTRFVVNASGETPLSRILQGRTPAEALRLIPFIFNLCPTAQGAAAAMAMGCPIPASTGTSIALETLREHALVMLRDWPAALRNAPYTDGLSGLAGLSADTLGKLEGTLFGRPAKVVLNDFENWMRRSSAGSAIDLATVSEWPKNLGRIEGRRDPTFIGRVSHHHTVADLIRKEGVTLFTRMAARAIEAALLIEAIRTGDTGPRCGRSVAGEGWAEAARGRLTHSVRTDNGRIVAYRINRPTDGMAGDGAFLEALLQSAFGGGEQPSRKRLAIALTCADPCMPVVWNRQAAHHA